MSVGNSGPVGNKPLIAINPLTTPEDSSTRAQNDPLGQEPLGMPPPENTKLTKAQDNSTTPKLQASLSGGVMAAKAMPISFDAEGQVSRKLDHLLGQQRDQRPENLSFITGQTLGDWTRQV